MDSTSQRECFTSLRIHLHKMVWDEEIQLNQKEITIELSLLMATAFLLPKVLQGGIMK